MPPQALYSLPSPRALIRHPGPHQQGSPRRAGAPAHPKGVQRLGVGGMGAQAQVPGRGSTVRGGTAGALSRVPLTSRDSSHARAHSPSDWAPLGLQGQGAPQGLGRVPRAIGAPTCHMACVPRLLRSLRHCQDGRKARCRLRWAVPLRLLQLVPKCLRTCLRVLPRLRGELGLSQCSLPPCMPGQAWLTCTCPASWQTSPSPRLH